MSLNIDLPTASSAQIEAALCAELSQLRLARNLTQAQLAESAGVSLRTVKRMEAGEGTTFDTFIRVLMALGIQDNLGALIPDPSVRPVERIRGGGRERQRARPVRDDDQADVWTWADDENGT